MSIRVNIYDLAVGGEGVGRLADGRVVFVAGAALNDELVVSITEEPLRKNVVHQRVSDPTIANWNQVIRPRSSICRTTVCDSNPDRRAVFQRFGSRNVPDFWWFQGPQLD